VVDFVPTLLSWKTPSLPRRLLLIRGEAARHRSGLLLFHQLLCAIPAKCRLHFSKYIALLDSCKVRGLQHFRADPPDQQPVAGELLFRQPQGM